MLESLLNTHHLHQYSPSSLHCWSSWIMSDQKKVERNFFSRTICMCGAVCCECDQRHNKFACKAKLHVLDDQVIKQVNDHTHVASRAVVESSKVRQEMKKRARETEERPQQNSSFKNHQPTMRLCQPCTTL